MSLEDRLRHALQDEADHLQVDLNRVRGLTEARVTAAPRRRRVWPLLAAAAAVAAVAGGVTVVARAGSPAPDRPPPAAGPHAPKAGGVATSFSCPHRSTVRFALATKDLSFVPSLEHGPRWFAAQMQAARFAFQAHGDTAVLRLGNADGSLGSVSTFSRTADGRWDAVRATKCVNGPYLADDPHRLGVLTSNPPFAEHQAREAARGCGTPTFVGGPGYYDEAGLLRHEWLYLASCAADQARLTVVIPGSGSVTATLSSRAGLEPADVGHLIPAGVDGKRGRVGLWALYDAHHSVAGLSAELKGGRSLPAEAVDLHGQQGTLYLLLAPRDEVIGLTVQPMRGAPVKYSSQNPPGYRQ